MFSLLKSLLTSRSKIHMDSGVLVSSLDVSWGRWWKSCFSHFRIAGKLGNEAHCKPSQVRCWRLPLCARTAPENKKGKVAQGFRNLHHTFSSVKTTHNKGVLVRGQCCSTVGKTNACDASTSHGCQPQFRLLHFQSAPSRWAWGQKTAQAGPQHLHGDQEAALGYLL